jgi:signal transduction histidine kinase
LPRAFSVAQEALHNAVKYSGIKKFAVEVRATTNEIQLRVSDAGAGFDVEEARKTSGLGLLSMHERVHLVQVRFYIESRPEEGTKVVATFLSLSELINELCGQSHRIGQTR